MCVHADNGSRQFHVKWFDSRGKDLMPMFQQCRLKRGPPLLLPKFASHVERERERERAMPPSIHASRSRPGAREEHLATKEQQFRWQDLGAGRGGAGKNSFCFRRNPCADCRRRLPMHLVSRARTRFGLESRPNTKQGAQSGDTWEDKNDRI
jgi:hypothetical protein